MGNSASQNNGHGGRINRKRTSRISRDQLRAKSFLQRERAAASEQTPLIMQTSSADDTEYIERLEDHIQRLSEKCAALESQNILVATQQLDLFARYFSFALSLSVLYGYWRLVGWILCTFMKDHPSSLIEALSEAGAIDKSTLGALAAIVQSSWFVRSLQIGLLLVPYLYNKWTHGSMHRRFQVFVIAFIIIIRIRMCRWREAMFLQNDPSGTQIPRYGEACTNDGIWEANYEISARFLYLSILRLRGLWTKTAQYLSSRADFVPVSYIRELSKLQDQAPITAWEKVERLLPTNLKKKLTDFEKEPLASASIGQVHVATLEGRKVVVKVQHPHARTLMMDDFWSLKVLTRIIGWLEPEYAFMEILMNEWAQEAVKELDFLFEAEHLREASQAIRNWLPDKSTVIRSNVDNVPFRAQVPEPIEELSNQKVLVMNFCEGCRIDDFDKMDEWGLPRAAVMDGVAQTFAHFMYCSTIFNGDPHAGNLLVRPGIEESDEGFTIVVLDWGLAKRLPEMKRVAFCQMVYAAATVDYGLLLDSYKTVGLKMKREDAGQSMEDMRFFLRDMAPRDVAKKRIKSKMKQGADIRKKTQEKVPMESKTYPGEFFFFIRVNELLHGLGSRFSVNLGYLDALSPYAEKGLRMSSYYGLPKVLDTKSTTKGVDSVAAGVDVNFAITMQKFLKDLESEKNLVGGQVCVIKDGIIQVDVVAGSLGGLRSHIPMQKDALILGYSTTKAITATLAHIMVQDGYLTYDEPVCERVWKKFCTTPEPPVNLHSKLGLSQEELQKRWQWKRKISLRHILNHSAALWSAFPPNLTIQKMASCESCIAGFEFDPENPENTVLPVNNPDDGIQAYHFLSFGWLVAGTLCGAYSTKHRTKSTATFQEVYEALLVPKLSETTRKAGFRPMGGAGGHILAQTVTADIRASQMIQRQRQMEMENDEESPEMIEAKKMMQMFDGMEFLVRPVACMRDSLYVIYRFVSGPHDSNFAA